MSDINQKIGFIGGGEMAYALAMGMVTGGMCRSQYNKIKAVAILPSTAIYPQRLFCRELFVIGQF